MSGRVLFALAFVAAALAACGTTTEDRALSGGAIGAGAGAIGGALGAGTGAFTNPNQIDLGKPAWQ